MEEAALNEEPVPGTQGTEKDQAADTHSARPAINDAGPSQAHGVCPFLRGAEGPLVAPASAAVDGQLCIAIGPPRAQSRSQQQLVCLRGTHRDCPRFQHGATAPPPRAARSKRAVPRATLAALLILVLSAGISFGFVVQRGGLDMPAVAEAGTATPEALVTPPTEPPAEVPSSGAPGASALAPEATPTIQVTASPTALPTDEPTALPTPTAEPTVEPTPTAAPTAKPTTRPKPTATPRSDRYKLLVKCPDRSGCWIYRIRSGDNLFSIANYFGHSLKTIYAWNPQYPDTRLKAGAQIRMPPPTR